MYSDLAQTSLNTMKDLQTDISGNNVSRKDITGGLIRRERYNCQVAIENYEKKFDSLQNFLTNESQILEEERMRMEREIVDVVNRIDGMDV